MRELLQKVWRRTFGREQARTAAWLYRPQYRMCLEESVQLAAGLGYPAISAIEFGVAGGNGLVALERHARELSAAYGVQIRTFGFDTGVGLPPPTDYRDLPYTWRSGDFTMDEAQVRARLTDATLVLGDVAETVPRLWAEFDPPPIGCVLIDLDFYSSTTHALRVLEADPSRILPRVSCYFDDVIGTSWYVGELRAISEFNERNPSRKITERFGAPVTPSWERKRFMFHCFDHPDYNKYVGPVSQELPLLDRRT